MSREGLGLIMGMVLFSAIMIVGSIANPFTHLKVMAVISALFTAVVINFFRDPERTIPAGTQNILSPADGKVVEIQKEIEGDYLKADSTRISIFLNIFDVHVNRIPIDGKIGYFRYQKGSFLQAYKSEASDVNEQTVIGVENGTHKILFKQIAGLIARRIVCNVREGNTVKSGERFGMIKFGSRVDVFLPPNAEVKVTLNQKVKGGESILGVFVDEV